MVRWTKTVLAKRFKPRKPNSHLSARGKGKSSSHTRCVFLHQRGTTSGADGGYILFNTQDQRVVRGSASLLPHPTMHTDTETAFRTFSLASWPFGGEVNKNPPSACRRQLRSHHAQSHTGSITPSQCPMTSQFSLFQVASTSNGISVLQPRSARISGFHRPSRNNLTCFTCPLFTNVCLSFRGTKVLLETRKSFLSFDVRSWSHVTHKDTESASSE